MPDLILKPKSDRRLRQGHLWIYSNEVDVSKSPLQNFPAGEQVNVLDAKGKALGTAIINPKQLICGRLVSRQAHEPLNLERLAKRLKVALVSRERLFEDHCYRWVYGDSVFV